MDFYTTTSVSKLFAVTQATVKNWSKEFADFLSPSATPEQGKKRVFSGDDLKVFALAHEYHQQGFGYDDVRIALRSGQRGDLPQAPADLVTTAPPELLAVLRDQIAARDALIETLKSERDIERGQVRLLKEQLADKEEKIEDLYIRLARFEAADENE